MKTEATMVVSAKSGKSSAMRSRKKKSGPLSPLR